MHVRLSGRWQALALACASFALLVLSSASESRVVADDATPAATPCAAVASPEANVIACAPVGLGTPVVGDGLVVTLVAGSTTAGPVDLIVEVRDAEGEPVEDATVEVRTRHLDMDHGVSTDEAVHQGNGRYLAEGVSMGMGGHWQAEVHITREGHAEVMATFLVELAGPTH